MTRHVMTALLVVFLATPGAAQEPRKVDFTAVLLDEGKPFVDDGLCPQDRATGERTCDTPLTLGRAVYYALRAPEQGLSWDEASRRDELAHALRDSSAWPLTDSDRDLIKKVMPKIWTPAVIGVARRLLEPTK